ncbi:MAG: HNH endonuclease [Planctomycetota bacterium]
MPIVQDKYRGTPEYDEVREILIQAALNNTLLPYTPRLSQILNLEPGNSMATELGLILGAISEDEHLQGRPMLSAAAISKKNRPGNGFFDLAKSLGKRVGRDKDQFWQRELELVYAYWQDRNQMNITDFFSDVIGVPLANHVWSWGVLDESNERVFLKIHEADMHADWEGWVKVYDPSWNSSAGHAERMRHIEWVRSGAKCFGVSRSKNNFDSHYFVRLGKIENEGELIYAEILGVETVDSILQVKARSTTGDLAEIARSNRTVTEKEVLISARIGQGEFRRNVLAMWNNKCAVTGVAVRNAIRASHIVPWRDSNAEQRLDPNNGLPLVATLDALFDANLISFNEKGSIQISDALRKNDRERLGIDERMKLAWRPSASQQAYLKQHRLVD